MRGEGNMLLTRELIKYRTRDNKVFPIFLPEDMPKARDLAATMIELATKLGPITVEEFEAALAEEADGALPFFKGMLKIFLGSSLNEEPVDLSSQRLIFLKNSQNLRLESKGDLDAFRRQMASHAGMPFEEVSKALYADLPAFSTLQVLPNVTVSSLLGSYNRALLKGIVLTGNSVQLECSGDLGSTRKLLRAAKFHRLVLESIEVTSEGSRMRVSGPLSISGQSVSYGLKLAHFIGTVIDLKNWKLQAEVKINSKDLKLELTSGTAFFGVNESSDAYVPKEFEILIGEHEIKGGQISIASNTEIIPIGKEMVFPDFCISTDKGSFYLELAHKWHQSCIVTRLNQPKALKEKRLILAIDKSLIKNDKVKESVDFAKKNGVPVLEFRDFPTVKAISEVLADFPKFIDLKESSIRTETSRGLRASTRSRREISGTEKTKFKPDSADQRRATNDIC
jgi:predicted nuclease of restriction endonuclease-like RecB superfamily